MNEQSPQLPIKQIRGSNKSKDKRITVRLGESELKSIQEKAEEANLRISSYLREAGRNNILKPGLRAEDRQVIREIISLLSRCSPLIKLSISQNCDGASKMLLGIQADLDMLLQKIYND